MADGPQPEPTWTNALPICAATCGRFSAGRCALLGDEAPLDTICPPSVVNLVVGIGRFCADFENPSQGVDTRGLYLDACAAVGRPPVDI